MARSPHGGYEPSGEITELPKVPPGPGIGGKRQPDATETLLERLLAELVDVNTQLQRIGDGIDLGNNLSMLALSKLDDTKTPGPKGETK